MSVEQVRSCGVGYQLRAMPCGPCGGAFGLDTLQPPDECTNKCTNAQPNRDADGSANAGADARANAAADGGADTRSSAACARADAAETIVVHTG